MPRTDGWDWSVWRVVMRPTRRANPLPAVKRRFNSIWECVVPSILDTLRRRAQEALQAAEAMAAVSARAEAERKGRGRLARLRAAWRGE